MKHAWRLLVAFALAALPADAIADPSALTYAFDFSKHEIGVNVTVKGMPLFMLLDTGVEPSIVDRVRATALGLPVDRGNASEGSGFGSGKAMASPATIAGLKIGGHAYPDVDALALDTAAISKGYGRPVDGVLGYSFLKDKAVLIDYAATTITVLSGAREAEELTHSCRSHYSIPLVFLGDNHWPVISEFHVGDATAAVTLDTGSSRRIGFYQIALQTKAIRDALKVTGSNTGAGARGSFTSKTAVLGLPVGLGPLRLPAGGIVSILPANGQSDKVVANIGNAMLAEISPELLLDYAGKTVSFYGDCAR